MCQQQEITKKNPIIYSTINTIQKSDVCFENILRVK